MPAYVTRFTRPPESGMNRISPAPVARQICHDDRDHNIMPIHVVIAPPCALMIAPRPNG